MDLTSLALLHPERLDDVLGTIDFALGGLANADPRAELVKLRLLAGLSIPQAAVVLGVQPAWRPDFLLSYARAVASPLAGLRRARAYAHPHV